MGSTPSLEISLSLSCSHSNSYSHTFTHTLAHCIFVSHTRTIDELRGDVDRERQRRETLERALEESRKNTIVLTMQCEQLKAASASASTRASRTNLKLPIE